MRILFFEPDITGHRQEYLEHLINHIQTNGIPGEFIFIVHPGFQAPLLHTSSITLEALLSSPPKRGLLSSCNGLASALLRSIQTYQLANSYAEKYHTDHICFLNFNDIQFALGLYRPKYTVSGILFKPFSRHPKDSLKNWLIWQRKYFQTWLYTRNHSVKSLFVLNDNQSADYLNKTFYTNIFQMLPDPVPLLTPEPNFDVRANFGIEPNRKIFLHIGSISRRKGTLDILDSLQFLTEQELTCFTLLIVGHAEPDMDAEILRRLPNSLIPDTRHPIPPIVYHNEYISSHVFKSLLDAAAFVLVPYRYTESSSGIAGHAIAAGKPMLAVQQGLLGEMVSEYGSGILIDECSPRQIAAGLQQFLAHEVAGKTSPDFLNMHTIEKFSSTILAALSR